ncbi:MAG: hypothetical protein R2839_05600 [Thermomicrobiales bacterium]
MKPAFLQAAESTDNYDPATIALFALFVVMLAVTAGLMLRDLLQENRRDLSQAPAQPDSHPASPPRHDTIDVAHPMPKQPSFSRQTATPAWYRQAVSGQSTGAAAGVRATIERMVEAANRGDLRVGFSLYTPEYLGREQQALGLDPGAFERLLREDPRPADPPLVLQAISEVIIDPPYRATATASYATASGETRPDERLRFLYDERNLIWLIDDIQAVVD